MDKLEYVIKTLSRTRRKDWENYVVNAVWNRLNDWGVKPVSQQYIRKHHRHCGPPKFHKFSVALVVAGEEEPVGIAVASTPKARIQMDGKTLEINRVCSDVRYADVCSKLYSLVVKASRNMGYCRFLTYTLAEEDGVGIKAAGFQLDGVTENAPQGWNSQSRPRCTEKYPSGPKKRWVLDL